MIYCEDCRFDKNWPQSVKRIAAASCEICGQVKLCYDIPKSDLPEGALEALEPNIYEQLAEHLGLTEDANTPNRWSNDKHEFFMLTSLGFRRVIPGKQYFSRTEVIKLLLELKKRKDIVGLSEDKFEEWMKKVLI